LWTIAGLAVGIVTAVILVAALIVWLAHNWRG
jgi:tetrahydromethanopterin S-methyltransferase subunit F